MENRVAIADDEEITFVAIRETETTSLLNGGQLVAEESTKAPRHRVVTFILTTFFISQLAFALLEPGYIAALELGICHEAYTNSDVSNCIDQDCKSPEIQGRLATLTGWQGTMACIPSLIVTVPYGMLSDRWGCNRVLLLAFVGSVLNATFSLSVLFFDQIFPVKTVLLSSLFELIGGGPAIIIAMIYTSLTDIVPVNSRATVFLQISSLSMISDIASNALAGLILSKSIWGLLLLAFGLLLIAALLSFLIPNTRKFDIHQNSLTVQESITTIAEAEAEADEGILSGLEILEKAIRILKMAWIFMCTHKKLMALMLALMCSVLPKIAQALLLQYTTKRYGWSWSKASFLMTIRSVVSLATLMVLLPALSHFLTAKLKLSARRSDILIARGTGLAGVIGALLVAFASTSDVLVIGLVVLALNSGMSGMVRSLLSSQVEPRQIGTLNTVIGVVDLLGIMLCSPAFYGSLRTGLELGGWYIGLPFMISAAITSFSTGIVFCLPMR